MDGKGKQVTITLDNEALKLEKLYKRQCRLSDKEPIARSHMCCKAYIKELKKFVTVKG